MPASEQTIQTIRDVTQEVDELKAELKTAREMLQDIAEKKPAALEVEECRAMLAEAQAKLKAALLTDAQYNNLTEKVAVMKTKLDDATEVLSNVLVVYYKETGERQVEISDTAAREVILQGRLGKETHYQKSLFSE